MKCPEYIKEAIRKREKYAYLFMDYDYTVSHWCDTHGVILETYDSHGGCESLVNPSDSADRVLRAIEESE